MVKCCLVRRENRNFLVGPIHFFPLPTRNSSLQIGEKIRVKTLVLTQWKIAPKFLMLLKNLFYPHLVYTPLCLVLFVSPLHSPQLNCNSSHLFFFFFHVLVTLYFPPPPFFFVTQFFLFPSSNMSTHTHIIIIIIIIIITKKII